MNGTTKTNTTSVPKHGFIHTFNTCVAGPMGYLDLRSFVGVETAAVTVELGRSDNPTSLLLTSAVVVAVVPASAAAPLLVAVLMLGVV